MSPQEAPKDILHYPDRVGLRGLTLGEMDSISRAFSWELRAGVEGTPGLKSLKMIDTHLTQVSQETLDLHDGEEVFVLEMGGTNVYAAWLKVEEMWGPEIMTAPHGSKPFEVRAELSTRNFENPDALFAELFHHIGELVRQRPIRRIGFVFTFPATIVDTPLGVDVMSPDKQTKDFRFQGISQKPVGAALIDFMRRSGAYDLSGLESLVVLNDTPAALLSGRGKIGGIVGTGYNLAMMVGGTIYNIESGGFSAVPQHGLARAVNLRSENEGEQLAEKQISGMYLGRQVDAALADLRDLGMNVYKKNKGDLSAEVISHILNEDWAKTLQHIRWDFKPRGTEEILRNLARPLRLRSAEHVAIQLASIVKTFPEEFPESRVEVPIEGSVFWGMPEYKDIVTMFADSMTGKEFSFSGRAHAGARGAAAAAVIGRKP